MCSSSTQDFKYGGIAEVLIFFKYMAWSIAMILATLHTCIVLPGQFFLLSMSSSHYTLSRKKSLINTKD